MSMNQTRVQAMLFAALAALSLPAPAADARIVFAWQATAQEALKPVQGLRRGPARSAGISLGLRAAGALLVLRAGDSFDRAEVPVAAAGPGVHQPIPGRKLPYRVPKEPLRLFAVASIEPFDPGPPPAPDSPEAWRAMAEAKAAGARDSVTRSADQTAAALFWNSGEDSDMDEVVKGLIGERGCP